MTRIEELDWKAPSSAATAGGMHELLAIALPMVVSHACDTVMMFTDRLFLSKLGPEQMNASMAGGLTCFVMTTFFFGLTGYSAALVAQYLGAGRKDRCATATTQAMLIALAAYPLILLARPLVHMAFARTGISAGQLAPQIEYFDIVVYATVIGLLRNCLSSFFSGIGRTRIVMVGAVTAMLANVGMNYILIFGRLGFPALGVRGAAYGTIIGGVFGLGVLLTAYLGGRTRRTYRVWGSLRFDRDAMAKLLRFGYPAGIEMFLNLMAFNAMIVAFHAHSPATATAVTIMFNWDMVSFVPLIGIQIGVMSLVGRYMGAGEPDIAHRAAMSGLKCGWLYSLIILIFFVFFPQHLVAVFRPEQVDAVFHDAAPIAVRMIRIASVYVMLEAVVVVFSGTLRGAGDTFWAMCVSVAIHWLMLAILIVTLYMLKLSPEAAWTGVVLAFLSFSFVFYGRYRGGKWRTIRMVRTQAELLATDHDHDFHEPRDL
ncbi:MAG TPA: MATE family efflux transporter [Sedimentisphaerales bacterium]|mgnify:CR=1 FL=1|nr:MATE family efflux transporter [Sedimentisphaerales bacterium]HRS09969.1 MATE family efflux transporter [Sedimentisphaerales bacterium]HRV46675.1 MATE family efflux transporter [Sedimentisphaerales bacterium]